MLDYEADTSFRDKNLDRRPPRLPPHTRRQHCKPIPRKFACKRANLHAQNHKYERARELARTRAETFCTKIAQKGVLHAKFGVQVRCEECKRPCKSLAHVQALLHARAILKC